MKKEEKAKIRSLLDSKDEKNQLLGVTLAASNLIYLSAVVDHVINDNDTWFWDGTSSVGLKFGLKTERKIFTKVFLGVEITRRVELLEHNPTKSYLYDIDALKIKIASIYDDLGAPL